MRDTDCVIKRCNVRSNLHSNSSSFAAKALRGCGDFGFARASLWCVSVKYIDVVYLVWLDVHGLDVLTQFPLACDLVPQAKALKGLRSVLHPVLEHVFQLRKGDLDYTLCHTRCMGLIY